MKNSIDLVIIKIEFEIDEKIDPKTKDKFSHHRNILVLLFHPQKRWIVLWKERGRPVGQRDASQG